MIPPGSLIGVTGANGHLGRLFCMAAAAAGYRLRCFGRRFDHLPADAETVRLDLAEPVGVDPEPLRGCDALVHLAAYIPRDHRSLEEGKLCWTTNVLGTARLLHATAAAGVRRLVQTSSASAYATDSGRTDEAAPLFPSSRAFYLGSKIGQEAVAREICAESGITCTTLRLSSVYGGAPPAGLPARLAQDLLAGRAITIRDQGRFGADFVFAPDVVRVLLMMLEEDFAGELNVASGVRTTLSDLAEGLVRASGAPPGLVELQPGAAAAADVGFPAIDIRRLRSMGVEPTALRAGLEQVVHALRLAILT
ncbi:NAD-dependent epimerase/dehydratase family protein [Sphingomonas arenae]|uniref:NAD-dependent epimerase/dehydratase family protein n=1 Tax=Sphingomonas arenae TaxID=2812555 RepID=UPI00196858BC|nr:NAD(P)-dependent oxidoreductase [Sphingomonas arenae]